jgi:protein-S-isoprenylcysteine O-methyltransferase Ste14
MRWFSSFSFVELSYIRLVEEQEMIARFGEEYLAYRRRAPFIIPRLRGGA